METRKVRIIKSRAGGTAMGNAVSYRVSLPTSWVREMGLEDSLSVEIAFDGDRIILTKPCTPRDFAENAVAMGHRVIRLSFYNSDTLCAVIYADYTDKRVKVDNISSDIQYLPFGNDLRPDWKDYQHFLSERCVSRDRLGIREYLESIGVAKYDFLEIIRKTEGRMAEDNCRLVAEEYEEDSTCY